MSAITKEPDYTDRTKVWHEGRWQATDFAPAFGRCYGQEPVPRNHFQGVTVGAWVRYSGRVWQVWSWHRQSGYVWLANGELYTEAPVRACEVLSQAQDDLALFEERTA